MGKGVERRCFWEKSGKVSEEGTDPTQSGGSEEIEGLENIYIYLYVKKGRTREIRERFLEKRRKEGTDPTQSEGNEEVWRYLDVKKRGVREIRERFLEKEEKEGTDPTQSEQKRRDENV